MRAFFTPHLAHKLNVDRGDGELRIEQYLEYLDATITLWLLFRLSIPVEYGYVGK